MPYLRSNGDMERARSIGHVPIIDNEMVHARLSSYRVFVPEPDIDVAGHLLVDAESLGVPNSRARWAMSFDGSPQEVAAREAFPSTRVLYLQIAGVLVHLEKMLGQAQEHFVDPGVIRSATQESLYSAVLPGSNVCRPDMPTVRDSWRAEIFEIFRDYVIEEETLLNTFMLLVAQSDKQSPTGGVVLARCSASESCSARNIVVPPMGTTCKSCGGSLFPTDTLRVHEEVAEEHSNVTPLGRLMTVLEHITAVAYLNFLFTRQPRVLGHVAFLLTVHWPYSARRLGCTCRS